MFSLNYARRMLKTLNHLTLGLQVQQWLILLWLHLADDVDLRARKISFLGS